MKKGYIGSLASVLAGLGAVLAQSPSPPAGSVDRASRPLPVGYAPGAYLPPPPAPAGEPGSLSLTRPSLTPPAPMPTVTPSAITPPAVTPPRTAVPIASTPPTAPPTTPAPLSVYPPVAPLPTLAAEPARPAPPPVPTPTPAPAPVAPGPCGPTSNVDGAFAPCDGLCRGEGDLWFRGEYLLWWTKSQNLPALVTTNADIRPVVGLPGTEVLFEGDRTKPRHGGRFTVGTWIDCDHVLGLEVSYFFLGERSTTFEAGGTGDPGTRAVGRPYFDVLTRSPNAALTAFPGVVGGTVAIEATSSLQGWAPNLIYNVTCDRNFRIDALVGFRYYELKEQLHVTETLNTPPAPVPGQTRLQVTDEFDSRNYFYGGSIGAQAEYRRGRWFAGGSAALALGTTHEVVNVRGSTLVARNGSSVATLNNGGFLALPSNIGRQTNNEFAVVPEVNLRLGAQLTDHVRAFVGYNLIYWSDVARPGPQVDLSLDPRQISRNGRTTTFSGATSPAPRTNSTDFWAQGLTFGIEIRY